MTERLYPTRVECHPMKDGGSTVRASIGYSTVYERAYSDPDNAREMAAALFDMLFDAPEDTEDF